MSLLIVRCPLKPLSGSGSPEDFAREWAESSFKERFEWCLVEDDDASSLIQETGVGATESMPYADEVLVLLPTMDVRLIEAKIPLTNAKKLQQILPNLIEEYVLTGAQALSVQALPPVPGKSALLRVIALIDRVWFTWITKQLESLASQRVRLIPECLLLANPQAENATANYPAVAYQYVDQDVVLTRRTSEQTGVAWIEKANAQDLNEISLPKALQDSLAREISWQWLVPSAKQFLQDNASSKSANYALNLLPKTFRREAGRGLSNLTSYLKRKRIDGGQDVRAISTWTDVRTWRQPLQWSKYFIITMVFGYLLHLGWLVFDDWRWGKQIEVLAAQSLTPASIAKLNQENAQDKLQDKALGSNGVSVGNVIAAFAKQVTQDQRRQGLVSDADFVPMAAKLQQLKVALGQDALQKMEYNGYAVDFEFKPGSIQSSSTQVMQVARSLGLMVKVMGPNRYRLEPYSGLGL